MKITILAVGKLKEDYLKEAFSYFENQIKKYCEFNIFEIPDEKNIEGASVASIETVKNLEGSRLIKKIKPEQYVIALVIEGKETNTEGLRKMLFHLRSKGKEDFVFVIGGSLGLSTTIINRSDYKLSFSPMTFPHQLMRIILMEQIYLASKDN